MKYLSIVWCLCIPYLFIDASTDAYEEEEVYEEEEEEACANCTNCANRTNQGKLIPMQALLAQANTNASSISASYTIARHHGNLFI